MFMGEVQKPFLTSECQLVDREGMVKLENLQQSMVKLTGKI